MGFDDVEKRFLTMIIESVNAKISRELELDEKLVPSNGDLLTFLHLAHDNYTIVASKRHHDLMYRVYRKMGYARDGRTTLSQVREVRKKEIETQISEERGSRMQKREALQEQIKSIEAEITRLDTPDIPLLEKVVAFLPIDDLKKAGSERTFTKILNTYSRPELEAIGRELGVQKAKFTKKPELVREITTHIFYAARSKKGVRKKIPRES